MVGGKLVENLLFEKSGSIASAMHKIDINGLGIVFLVDEQNRFSGTVTDGDIRNAVQRGVRIESSAAEIANKTPVTISEGADKVKAVKFLLNDRSVLEKIPKYGSLKIPVLNDGHEIVDVVYLHFKEEQPAASRTSPKHESIKKVLVIGGAGYLGSELCKQLLECGYSVRVLDNLMCGDSGIKKIYGHENFELVKGDMRNITIVMDAVQDVDAVIHLAAIVGDPACKIDPRKTIEVNNFSTKMIGEICKYDQINRLVFASTCSVYGASDGNDFLTEDSQLNPVSLYADMKIRSEKSLLELSDGNFSPTILRMPTLFGASNRMRFDLVINKLSAQAANGENVTISGGGQWRPFLHVRDAAKFYIQALRLPIDKVGNLVVNIGSDNLNHRIGEIGEAIKRVKPSSRVVIDESDVDKRNYRVDFTLCKRVFAIEPEVTIEDGIREILTLDKRILNEYRAPIYSNLEIANSQRELTEG